jgi:hypothetical protein
VSSQRLELFGVEPAVHDLDVLGLLVHHVQSVKRVV